MKAIFSISFASRLPLAAMVVLFLNSHAARADLTIVPPDPAKPLKVLHLGDTLVIRATGKHATDIRTEAANITHRKLTLFLNGIEIPELTASFAINPPPGASVQTSHGTSYEALTDRVKEADDALQAAVADLTKKKSTMQAAVDALAKTEYGKRKKVADDLKETAARYEEAAAKAESAKAANAAALRAAATEARNNVAGADKSVQEVAASAAKELSDVLSAKAPLSKAALTANAKKHDAVVAEQNLAAANEGEVDVSFVVERHSESKDSREAWDKLLRPLSFPWGKDELEVALAVGGMPPEYVNRAGALSSKGVLPFEAVAVVRFGWAVFCGLAMLALCLGLIYRYNHMLRENSNPSYAISLGRTQMAFWGVLVLSCFTGVLIACGGLEAIPAQTLILLGISAGTALSARVIDGDSPHTPRSALQGFSGFLDDLLSGDSGASFHRVQVVMWTMVLGLYFVYNVVWVISMPEFPETLLILMGISNGTYLGFKMQEGKFDVSPVEMKQATLKCNISGGTAPYQWALAGDLPAAVTVKSGSQPRPGPLVLPIGQPAASGKLTLSITDKNNNSSTQVFDFSKPKLDSLAIKDGLLTATISEAIAPYSLKAEGSALDQPATLDKQQDSSLQMALTTLLKKTGGDVKLTVTDARGLTADSTVPAPAN